MSLMPDDVEHAALVGREQLGAQAPGPFLLPDDVALPLDVAAELDGLGLIGVAVWCCWPSACRLSTWSRLQEIAAPELDGGELLLGAGDPAQGQRAFGIEEVAVLPAGLGADALAGAVAELAGDGAHRRRLELDGEVDGPAVVGRDHPDLGRGDQAGGDQRPAQIVDLRAPERLAGLEAGDRADVARR